jgi:antitoxin MazE
MEAVPMKAKLVQIGNSRGIRLLKPMIEEAKLNDEVDIHVTEGAIVITSSPTPRSGWAEAAKQLHDRKDDGLLDSGTATIFDETEWKW